MNNKTTIEYLIKGISILVLWAFLYLKMHVFDLSDFFLFPLTIILPAFLYIRASFEFAKCKDSTNIDYYIFIFISFLLIFYGLLSVGQIDSPKKSFNINIGECQQSLCALCFALEVPFSIIFLGCNKEEKTKK